MPERGNSGTRADLREREGSLVSSTLMLEIQVRREAVA